VPKPSIHRANKVRDFDILGDGKRGGRYHWHAINIDAREATGEACCSISGRGAHCEGFKEEESAKKAGDARKKT
jgi:hypothetical protein